MPEQSLPRHARVAIVGTGFSGLGTAIRLARAGRRDFVVLERAGDVGGTWRDNTYPGAACDVPSRLYSFSFRLNPDWTRAYSTQPEILEYLRTCAREAGVLPHIRFQAELLDAAWDGDDKLWRITTARGVLTANFLVMGTGALVEPALPNIPGLEDFAGAVFHSARWNHDHDLTDRQVGVIGTGASAIQFVPQVQRKAGAVTLFQRTPPWVDAAHRPRDPRSRALGLPQRAGRAPARPRRGLHAAGEPGRRLRSQPPSCSHRSSGSVVSTCAGRSPDPALREKLTPRYSIGCKRILISNDYYPALAQPNVAVVTDGIERVEADGIRTADGKLHRFDTLILGTGFRVTDNPGFSRIRGRDGVSLEKAWADSGMRAHLGTSVPGFPNMFLLLGPNTGIGHTSAVYMIESQIAFVTGALEHTERHGIVELEVRPEVEATYNARLAERSSRTVWNSGCASWYLDAEGRNTVLWPDLTFRFRRLTRRFRPSDYVLVHREVLSSTGDRGARRADRVLGS